MVENNFKMPEPNNPKNFGEQTVFKAAKEESHPASKKINENAASSLAYLAGFVSGIIVLVIEKENPVVRFHALQSIYFSLVFLIVFSSSSLVPVIGWIFGAVLAPIGLVMWIILMLSAFNGKKIKIMYIGGFVEKYLK